MSQALSRAPRFSGMDLKCPNSIGQRSDRATGRFVRRIDERSRLAAAVTKAPSPAAGSRSRASDKSASVVQPIASRILVDDLRARVDAALPVECFGTGRGPHHTARCGANSFCRRKHFEHTRSGSDTIPVRTSWAANHHHAGSSVEEPLTFEVGKVSIVGLFAGIGGLEAGFAVAGLRASVSRRQSTLRARCFEGTLS